MSFASLETVSPVPNRPGRQFAAMHHTKRRAVENNEAREPALGLSFGSAARSLPFDFESLCYSFLQLDDINPLAFVSHALRTRVSRHLSALKTLEVSLARDSKQGLALAAQCCASLTDLRCYIDMHRTPPAFAAQWFSRIVLRSHRTLRRVQPPFKWSNDAFAFVVTHCNKLEHIDLTRSNLELRGDLLRPEVLAQLTLASTPNLASLSLYNTKNALTLQQMAQYSRIFGAGVLCCVLFSSSLPFSLFEFVFVQAFR